MQIPESLKNLSVGKIVAFSSLLFVAILKIDIDKNFIFSILLVGILLEIFDLSHNKIIDDKVTKYIKILFGLIMIFSVILISILGYFYLKPIFK